MISITNLDETVGRENIFGVGWGGGGGSSKYCIYTHLFFCGQIFWLDILTEQNSDAVLTSSRVYFPKQRNFLSMIIPRPNQIYYQSEKTNDAAPSPDCDSERAAESLGDEADCGRKQTNQ